MLLPRVITRAIKKRVCFIRLKHVWTADRIVNSPFDDIVIPDATIPEFMWKNLDKWSDKTAVVCGITDRKYSYLQLYKDSQNFAVSLRKKIKIKDGDTVVIMLPNLPEYPAVILGILTAGALASTINPVYTAYEVQRQITMAEAKLIVTNPESVPTVKEALKLSKLEIPVIVVDVDQNRPDGTVSYKELVNDIHLDKDILKEVKRQANDTALLLFSSGTTGLPKGVQLTNRNIVANSEQQNVEMSKKYNDTTATNQDIELGCLPMFHCYGLSVATLHKLSVGLKLVTLPKFHPDTFVRALEKHKITLFYVAPPLILFMASSPQVTSKHFEALKFTITGAAPAPLSDIERFINKVGHDFNFSQAYGLTETSPLATINTNESKDYTSSGFVLANSSLRIVDNQMNNLGPNETGELLIKGPMVMKGYKNNPEANSQVFAGDGWFRSGDLAKIDESGRVTIMDRLKELIKVNAYQVPPAELESIIKEHPAVFDAAVVGVPDDRTGEKPKAFVVLNKDVNVDEQDIIDFVNQRVAPYKRLKEVQFLENIQKNPSGKILRRLLVEQYVKK